MVNIFTIIEKQVYKKVTHFGGQISKDFEVFLCRYPSPFRSDLKNQGRLSHLPRTHNQLNKRRRFLLNTLFQSRSNTLQSVFIYFIKHSRIIIRSYFKCQGEICQAHFPRIAAPIIFSHCLGPIKATTGLRRKPIFTRSRNLSLSITLEYCYSCLRISIII